MNRAGDFLRLSIVPKIDKMLESQRTPKWLHACWQRYLEWLDIKVLREIRDILAEALEDMKELEHLNEGER